MKLHNTLSGQIEKFEPIESGKVKMFVCGPTVYDLSHIGHAKTYIQMDILARTLREAGYDVYYLQNITDIDDKIIARANDMGINWEDLRSRFESEYKQDMETLNNTSVDTYARATDHIENIIKQVETLLEKKHAYEIERDGIYFEIATFPEYGKLSGRKDIQADDALSRIDDSDKKKGWNDFCLWKFSKPGEPSWKAPFGSGRPGWHIEDTAITEHYFGVQYDIHGGAIDLIFPHHEAELTQMESISDMSPFVRYWTHSGFLNIEKEKMSKSLGNFLTIRELLEKGYEANVLRLSLIQAHYRSSMNFSWDLLEESRARLRNMQAVADLRWQPLEGKRSSQGIDFIESQSRFLECMYHDLDTPEALAHISRDFNHIQDQLLYQADIEDFNDYLQCIDRVLGLDLLASDDINNELKDLLTERRAARERQDWSKADELRNKLLESGVSVRDTDYGQIWSRP